MEDYKAWESKKKGRKKKEVSWVSHDLLWLPKQSWTTFLCFMWEDPSVGFCYIQLESNSNNKWCAIVIWEYENVERGNAMHVPSQLELCDYIFRGILLITVIFFSVAWVQRKEIYQSWSFANWKERQKCWEHMHKVVSKWRHKESKAMVELRDSENMLPFLVSRSWWGWRIDKSMRSLKLR